MSTLHTVFGVAENAKAINEFITDMAHSASKDNISRDASDGFCAMGCVGLGILSSIVLWIVILSAIFLHLKKTPITEIT